MEFRIVRDGFAGYEVQARRWWFPVWIQCGGTNTHKTLEDAEAFAVEFAKIGRCIKYLGRLPSNALAQGREPLCGEASPGAMGSAAMKEE